MKNNQRILYFTQHNSLYIIYVPEKSIGNTGARHLKYSDWINKNKPVFRVENGKKRPERIVRIF